MLTFFINQFPPKTIESIPPIETERTIQGPDMPPDQTLGYLNKFSLLPIL